MTITAPSLELTRVLKATPDKVYAAWSDPAVLKQWFGPGDCTVIALDFEPEENRPYSISLATPDGDLTVAGVFLKVEPNRHLEFSFQWQADPGEPEEAVTTVSVAFQAEGQDTRLVLTHEGHPSQASSDRHEEGWTGSLANLEQAL